MQDYWYLSGEENKAVFLITLVRNDTRHDGWGEYILGSDYTRQMRVCWIKVSSGVSVCQSFDTCEW